MPVTLLWILCFHFEGGAAAFAEQTSLATSDGLNSTPLIEIVALLAAFLLGETLIPPYANRALASKTTRVSQNGFILAGCFSVAWFAVMVALGIAAHGVPSAARAIEAKAAEIREKETTAAQIEATESQPAQTRAEEAEEEKVEDYVLLILFRSTMPAAGYALLLVVLISIIMSSLDSLLNAGAVAFTQDIVKPFAKLPDAAALNVGRCATIAIALTAAAGAVAVDSIINGLLICYAIWAPAILPALIIGLWVKRPRPLAGILSMGVGSIVAVTLWVMFKFILHWKTEISRIIIPALAAALLAYLVGHWIQRPNPERRR